MGGEDDAPRGEAPAATGDAPPAATGDAPTGEAPAAGGIARRVRALPRPAQAGAAVALLAAVALAVVLLTRGAGPLPDVTPPPASLADAVPYDGRSPLQPRGPEQRVLVQLRRPALGALPDARAMGAEDKRTYVDSLKREATTLRSGLAARGVVLRDVVGFYRVWNGFAATVSTRDLARLNSPGVRVRTVRRAYPASGEPVPVPDKPELERAGLDAQPPVAVLDTGVDSAALAGHADPGYDAVDRDRDPAPGRDPGGGGAARDERHGARGRRGRRSGSACCRSGSPRCARSAARSRPRRRPTGSSPGSSTRSTRTATPTRPTTCRSRWSASTRRTRGSRTRPRRRPSRAPAGSGRSSSRRPATRARRRRGAGRSARPRRRGTRSPSARWPAASRRRGFRSRGSRTPPCSPATPPRDGTTAGPVEETDPAKLDRALRGRIVIVRAGANPAAQAAAAAAVGARAVVLADPRERPLPALPAGRAAAPVIGVTGEAADDVLALEPGSEVRFGEVERAPRPDAPVARVSHHVPGPDGRRTAQAGPRLARQRAHRRPRRRARSSRAGPRSPPRASPPSPAELALQRPELSPDELRANLIAQAVPADLPRRSRRRRRTRAPSVRADHREPADRGLRRARPGRRAS